MSDQGDAAFAVHVLGRRFGCDFRVMAIGSGTATLVMYGKRYVLSVTELRTIIERGFVVELPDPQTGGVT